MNDDSLTPEEREARIQRALNESKKRELEGKYDARFHESGDLPPDVERQWLDNIERFEQACAGAKRTTVRHFIGNPTVTPIDKLQPDQVQPALDTVISILNRNDVFLDFLAPTPIEEQYRFITEELLDVEIDDIRMHGFQHRFIYEEFHPNDRLAIEDTVNDVLYFFFDKQPKMFAHYFAHDGFLSERGEPLTKEEVMDAIRRVYETVLAFTHHNVTNVRVNVEGDAASAEAELTWKGLAQDAARELEHTGTATFRLQRSPYGGWDVMQMSIPGCPLQR